jgi:hypothetical protein
VKIGASTAEVTPFTTATRSTGIAIHPDA